MCQIKIKHTMPNSEILEHPYTVESFDGEDANHWYCTLTNIKRGVIINYAFPKRRIITWVDDRDEDNKKIKVPVYERNPRPAFLDNLVAGSQEKVPF